MTLHATSDPCDAVLDEIASVKRAMRAIDVQASADASVEASAELSRSLVRVFEEAYGLGVRLTDFSDEILENTPERASFVGALGTRPAPSALDVGDLAFVLRMSLNRHQREFEAARSPASMLAVCARWRDELEQALAALEQRFQGEPASLVRERGVDASLKCRRAYAHLRAGLEAVGEVARGREGSVSALRAAGALIALLIGSDGYPYFRAADRLQLASLERRVLSYLEHGGSAARGLRVFHDFKAFVDRMAVINLRQDLKNHDACCLTHWLAELDDTVAGTIDLLDSVAKYREAIRGRDADFDALLEGRATLTRVGLVNDLRRMLGSLALERESSGEHALPGTPARTSA